MLAWLTTAGGRQVWCFDASGPRHSARNSVIWATRPAGTSPPHLSRQTVASLELQVLFVAGTCLPAQLESSWAGTGSECCFLFHSSGGTQQVRSQFIWQVYCTSIYAVCVHVCLCVRACTSFVKDTKSWTKLPMGLKAVMNPFTTCVWQKRRV